MSSETHTAPTAALRHGLPRLIARVWPAQTAPPRRAKRPRRRMSLTDSPITTPALWTLDREELQSAVDDAGVLTAAERGRTPARWPAPARLDEPARCAAWRRRRSA
jgi:hypothetical protein